MIFSFIAPFSCAQWLMIIFVQETFSQKVVFEKELYAKCSIWVIAINIYPVLA